MKPHYKGVIKELKGSYTRFAREVKRTTLITFECLFNRNMYRPFNSPLTPLLFLLTPLFCSCGDDKDDAPYPSIVTEMVDCPTDAAGHLTKIVLDDNTQLSLTNPLSDLKPSVTYRALAGYTLTDGKATLYQLKAAALLHDSTAVAQTDPLKVVSVWRTKRYFNFHLQPKTQGGQQTWGFITDSIVGKRAYLRLHHRQGDDPTAYTTDVYASLYLQDIAADSITIRINTFSGLREWNL